MTKKEKQRANEQLIFTHIRMGNYELARVAMTEMDTSRLWAMQRDAEILSDLAEININKRTGEQHAPEQFPEDQGRGFDIKEWDNG